MRKYSFLGLLVLAIVCSYALRAEDAKKTDEKPADAKAADAKPADDKPTEIKTGVLSEKPVNAADGVVAVLTVKNGPDPAAGKAAKKRNKKGGDTPPAEQKFNLLATGDIATKLTDLTKKGATADVTGVVNLDAMTMKVTAVTESTATPPPEKKKKKNK
jgi:hypothetical protein